MGQLQQLGKGKYGAINLLIKRLINIFVCKWVREVPGTTLNDFEPYRKILHAHVDLSLLNLSPIEQV